MPVPMIMIFDTGVAAFERLAVLDAAENFINDATNPDRYDEALTAIADDNWTPLALRIGVDADQCRCFLSDVWGAERKMYLAAIEAGIRVAKADGGATRFALDLRPAQTSATEYDYDEATSTFTVVLKRAVPDLG